jgi:hypothetical protein
VRGPEIDPLSDPSAAVVAQLSLSHAGGAERAPSLHELRAGEVLLIGRSPSIARLGSESAVPGVALLRPVPLTLALPFSSCVSRLQLVLWAAGEQVLAGAPATSRRVQVQPWGHQARSTALAGLPAGEPIDGPTTLWLPWSDARAGHAGGRWRMAVAPCVPASASRVRWDTVEPADVGALTDPQVDAVIRRFGDFLHFPARTTAPEPRPFRRLPDHQRKAVEHRLDAVRKAAREARGLPELGTDQRLLQVLLDSRALGPADVLARAADHEIELAGHIFEGRSIDP